MTHARWRAGFALLVFGIWLLTADQGGQAAADDNDTAIPIAAADFKKLVARSTKNIQKSLAKKSDKKSLAKARMDAIMIAAYAQYTKGGPDAEEAATLRDAALKLAETIKAGKIDDAVKQAEALESLKADPKAKTAPVAIFQNQKLEIGEVMHQFAVVAEGGYGVEDHLKKLTSLKKDQLGAQMNEDFVLTAYQAATVGELIKGYKPEKKGKEFLIKAENMRKTAILLAESTKKKEGAAASILYKLTIDCGKCHQDFRE